MSAVLELDAKSCDRLIQTMQAYQGDTEETVNDVLHNYAPGVMKPAIRNLMPVSGKTWKGKKPAAKSSQSLENMNGNLSVTVKSTKNYQYLYFPDSGETTRRHAGRQYFFRRGGESVQDEIIDRCVTKLVDSIGS